MIFFKPKGVPYSTYSSGKFDGITTAQHIGFYVKPWPHALKLELRPCVQTDISNFHNIIPPIYRYRKNVIPTELNIVLRKLLELCKQNKEMCGLPQGSNFLTLDKHKLNKV